MILLKDLIPQKLSEDLHAQAAEIRPSHQFSGFSNDFYSFVRDIENAAKTGYNKSTKTWLPHPSPEGGYPTIGYGHKIKSNSELERMKKGLSNSDVERLLKSDLEEALHKVHSYIKQTFKLNIPLDREQTEILTEYAFNLGTLSGFPKFTEAIINKDWERAKKEYIVYSKDPKTKIKSPIPRRNPMVFNRYLKNK
jgi:GH24 family phage-related lysozyme (muramidase)